MITAIFPTTIKNRKYLELAVYSLESNSSQSYKVIVSENGEGTPYAPGQWSAINRVLDQVDTEYVAIFNDDMYFAPDWDRMADFSYDCFCPNWIEPVTIGSAPPFLKLNAGDSLETFNMVVTDKFIKMNDEYNIENGFNLGCFIKTDLLKKIGGCDEMYDPYGSNGDTDLQMKIELAGVMPVRNRGMLIYHFGSKSESFTPDKQSYWQKNWDYLTDKWGFNRDDAKSDTWYCKNMIMYDKLKYHPDWEEK